MVEVSTSHVVLSWALYYEVNILASEMPKLQKGRKPLQNKFLSLPLSITNQKEILKRSLNFTKPKPKGKL